MSEPTCSVPDCGRDVRTKGFCNPHYQRLKTTGDVQANKPIRVKRTDVDPNEACRVEGCDRGTKSRGWCLMHYKRWARTGNAAGFQDSGCAIPGCERSHYGGPGGWCRLHYRRWRIHGDPLTKQLPPQCLPKPKKPCKKPNCRRDAVSRGMCRRHWGLEYRRENPAIMTAIRQRRSARVLNAPANDFTAEQWEQIKALYGQRCAYCNKRRKLTVDHVIALSRGGANTASNIVPACRSCNSRKNAGPPPTYQPLLI